MSESCVTTTIVIPDSRFSRWKMAMISMPVRESSAPVGSSARMIARIVDQRARDGHPLLLARRRAASADAPPRSSSPTAASARIALAR